MEQFSLEKWLQDKSRKIVTRDGKPVRIVCWDLKCDTPIIAAIQWNQEREDCYCYNTKGWCANNEGELDLFFADEEEKLSEFESKLADLLVYNHPMDIESANSIARRKSKILLEFARKEIREKQQEKLGTIEMPIDVTEPYYIKGKQDALKDLPKWKKAEKDEELDCHVAIQQDDRVVLSDFVQKDEYYITLNVLKKLPKEE